MSSSSIRVVARFIAKPDKIEALKGVTLALIEPTRRESGCISYDLLHNSADSSDFTFVEEWASAAALDAHMKAPHVAVALGKLGDLLGAPPDIRRYSKLS